VTAKLPILLAVLSWLALALLAGQTLAASRRAQDIPTVEASDPSRTPALFEAPRPSPTATSVPAAQPTSTPAVSPVGLATVSGIAAATATWYCQPGVSRCTVGYSASCLCAAASPDLHLRGKWIRVAYGGRAIAVRVVDCLCSRAGGLDLYASVWGWLGIPLSLGVVRVKFTVLG
jgi:hypothetical protein